eukprot:gene34235-40045_t
MNGGSRIIDLRPNSAAFSGGGHDDGVPSETTPHAYEEPIDLTDVIEDAPARYPLPWPAFVGAVVSLGWVGGMLALSWSSLATLTPPSLASFVASLCVPPALIGIVLLLTQRSSRAEAKRFGVTARAMRAEAASLERTVAVLGRTID